MHFVAVRAELSSDRAAQRPQIPELESLALQASLEADGSARNLAAARRHRGEIEKLLSLKPLSPEAWLELAGLRVITGEPFRGVLRALEMSWITGPNEGFMMMERALFALLEWRALPRDAQGRILQDLAGAIRAGAASADQILLAKTLLADEPAVSRKKIGSMLRMDGLSRAQQRALGL